MMGVPIVMVCGEQWESSGKAIMHRDVRREAFQSRTAHQPPILKYRHHPAAATRGTSPCDTLRVHPCTLGACSRQATVAGGSTPYPRLVQ